MRWAGLGGGLVLLVASANAQILPEAGLAFRPAADVPALLLHPQGIGVERDPPAGSGPEYTRYAAEPEVRNRFIIGGLLAWMGVLVGGLMALEKRMMTAVVIGVGGLAIGVALMLSGVI